MLKYMDERGVVDRSDCIDPIIILEGHILRMICPLLDYGNHPKNIGSAMVGIPYNIHMWQVRRSRMAPSKYQ
jgi:hypothetical protein